MREQSSINGEHAPDWESRSWPSKPNRTDVQNGSQSACIDEIEERKQTYREIAKEFVKGVDEDLEGRIFRSLSVSGDTRLRREAVRQRRGEATSYRSKTVAGVMQEFLTWFLEQEDLELQFQDFTMEVGSSFNKDAALERYGGLCDLERGALEACRHNGDDLYTALLGITASHRNANDQYRCPADHWREMKESWSNHVRQEQQRVFDNLGADRYDPEDPPERWWEYVRIAEPHKSGYAHHHIAIVTNFQIDVETFEPVIARHVKETPSANWSAHQIDVDDPEKQCVSVNRIDPEKTDQEDVVGNLATYLSGYLSEFGEDGEYVRMINKSPAEVMFAATAWATGSRKIDYSNGGHRLKALGYKQRPEGYKKQGSDGDCLAPTSVRNVKTDEEYEILEPGAVETVFVEDQPQLDPEKVFVVGTLEATR